MAESSMRNLFSLLLIAVALGGCGGSDGRTGPGEIPVDAFGAMYTNLPAEQVASCLVQAVNGTLEQTTGRFLVTAPGYPKTTYDVGPNATEGVYPTEVIVRGRQDPIQQQRAATCFAVSLQSALT